MFCIDLEFTLLHCVSEIVFEFLLYKQKWFPLDQMKFYTYIEW